jgi:hypothetical protein
MTCCSVRFRAGRSVATGNCVFRSSLRVFAQFLHRFLHISRRSAVLTPKPSLYTASPISCCFKHPDSPPPPLSPSNGPGDRHFSPSPQQLQPITLSPKLATSKILHLTRTLQRTTAPPQPRHGDDFGRLQPRCAPQRSTYLLVSKAGFNPRRLLI